MRGAPGGREAEARRYQWHTFWNASDQPPRVLEIISPGGVERVFERLSDMGGVTEATAEAFGSLCQDFVLEMDPGGVPDLLERFGLRFPGEPVVRRR